MKTIIKNAPAKIGGYVPDISGIGRGKAGHDPFKYYGDIQGDKEQVAEGISIKVIPDNIPARKSQCKVGHDGYRYQISQVVIEQGYRLFKIPAAMYEGPYQAVADKEWIK
ncbi:hypothetical protein D3H65_30985 [Paraflavitalea soli]|uniref:Uncharacterized protein n=1 Tax=Paraflavitalea soli TaxID=2315862 RepID=A0A3B7MXD6_9BACT|nr:hypothetical protein [Paraflavitalea soli]AXY78153.1 hypothetical protein D3H65_30985 [Paraflavitalea soli]